MEGVIFDGISHQLPDIDPTETEEWVGSFDAVLEVHGKQRASFLLMKLLERAQEMPGRLPGHRVVALRQHHPGQPRTLVPR